MSYYPENDYGQQLPTAPEAPSAPQAPQMDYVPQLPQAPQMGFASQMDFAPQLLAVPQMNYVLQLTPAPSINIVNTLTAGAQVSTGVKKTSCKRTFAMVIFPLRVFVIFIALVACCAFADKLKQKGYNPDIYFFLCIAALLFEVFGFFGACNNSLCMMVIYTVATTVGDLLTLGIIIDFPWIIFCICFCVSLRNQGND